MDENGSYEGSGFFDNAQFVAEANDGGNVAQFGDTVGVMVLGCIAFMLLLALLRSHKQTRKLLEKQLDVLQSA
ncbi:MAG: hypothetical protein GYB66_16260 [Chloroflexi bacterium]|nr:hypothetical protein [Chloroflexota bacterium]